MIILGFTLPQWAAIFTIIAAVFGLIRPLRKFTGRLWAKSFGRRGAQLDRIESELRPNGGDSLRDIVDNISRKQSDFDAFLTASLNIHEDAVFRTDAEGRVIFTNRAHQRLTGFSPNESLGDGWINYLAPHERERMIKIWKATVTSGRELNEDIDFMRPDHTEYRVRAHVYREIDSKGRIRGYLGVIYPLDAETGCPHKNTCLDHFETLMRQSYAENSGQKKDLSS